MTYGQMRDRVLMLLNQYSIAGGKIRVTYNNQADYLARVPGAVNEALVYLATTARRLRSGSNPKRASTAPKPRPRTCRTASTDPSLFILSSQHE